VKNAKRNILNAAKENINADFKSRIDILQEQYDKLINAEASHDELVQITQEIDEIQGEWSEWKCRAKKNKRKISKRVKWTNTRDQHQHRTVNQDALDELRKSRKEKAKPEVGVAWLFEGALVTLRGKTDMMIVTRLAGSKVECLSAGTTCWLRGTALRPADWLTEE